MAVKFGPGDTKGSDIPNAPTQGEAQPGIPSTSPTPGISSPNLTDLVAQAVNNNPQGQARYYALLANATGTPNSQQYDDWLLKQQNDPSDPEFNLMLVGAKAKAQERQTLRGLWDTDLSPTVEAAIERGESPKPPQPKEGLAPNEKSALATANQIAVKKNLTPEARGEVKQLKTDQANANIAEKRAANEDATRGKVAGGYQQIIIGPDGQPIQSPAGNAPTPSQSGALSGAPTVSPQDVGKKIQQGGYVWWGSGQSPALPPSHKPGEVPAGGPQGRTNYDTDAYMSTDDAKNDIARWDPGQIKAYQKLMNLPQTGLPDAKTFAAWSAVIDTAERLTIAGKKVDPMTIALTYAKNGGAGGGGGGGGGGGSGFKMSDVQALLTSVMQNEAGRDPTQAEVNAFFSYFNGQGDTANPTQVATNWIRQNLGGQVGSYQAATTYYQAMLSVLGNPAGGSVG